MCIKFFRSLTTHIYSLALSSPNRLRRILLDLKKDYLKINYFKYYNRIIKIFVESGSSSPSLTSSATLHRLSTRASGSASSKHIPLAHRTNSIGRFQPCASFGFFQIGHLPFTKITFLDTCQKTVSTHAPQFRNNLFCSEITPTSIQSHSSYPVHMAYPYNWVKLFFAPGLSPSICASPTCRFTFRLFTCPDRSIKITLRLYIGNKPPLATTPLPFSFQQLQKP